MTETKHTPPPWKVGEFDEHLGYDCMTAGIRVGPVYLDGQQYGQESCKPMTAEMRAQMEADARLIAAAPDMFKTLQANITTMQETRRRLREYRKPTNELSAAIEETEAALAKAVKP